MSPKVDGVGQVAEMLNVMDEENRLRLLKDIEQRDPALFAKIKEQMFTFESLLQFDSQNMQIVIKAIPGPRLALALRACSDELKKHFLDNMSKRAGETLQEEMLQQGPQKVTDVQAAQYEIALAVRKMIDDGQITGN